MAAVYKAIAKFFKFAYKRHRRREQIKFLRDTIFSTFRELGGETPRIDVNGYRQPNAIPQRAARFNHLLAHIDIMLKHRTKDFSHSEASSFRLALSEARDLHAMPRKDDWQDLVTYACIYRRFQKLEWLGLPSKLPWRDADEDG